MSEATRPACREAGCGVADPKYLVRCTRCSGVFCNARSDGKMSHAAKHVQFVRGHTELRRLVDDGSQLNFECRGCKSTNVLSLSIAHTRHGPLHQPPAVYCSHCIDDARHPGPDPPKDLRMAVHLISVVKQISWVPVYCPKEGILKDLLAAPSKETERVEIKYEEPVARPRRDDRPGSMPPRPDVFPSVDVYRNGVLDTLVREQQHLARTVLRPLKGKADLYKGPARVLAYEAASKDAGSSRDRDGVLHASHGVHLRFGQGAGFGYDDHEEGKDERLFLYLQPYGSEHLEVRPGSAVEVEFGPEHTLTVYVVDTNRNSVLGWVPTDVVPRKGVGFVRMRVTINKVVLERSMWGLQRLHEAAATELAQAILGDAAAARALAQEVAAARAAGVEHKDGSGAGVGEAKDPVYAHNRCTPYTAPLNLPEGMRLNEGQERAVRHALSHPLSLVQGPPGTGKTVTSAAIIHELSVRYNYKVLAVASSNDATDNLAERLLTATHNLTVVRVVSTSRVPYFGPHSPLYRSALHVIVHDKLTERKIGSKTDRYNYLRSLRCKNDKFRRAVQQIEDDVLDNAHVVLATCASSHGTAPSSQSQMPLGRYRNAFIRGEGSDPFDALVVDEAGTCSEADLAIPLDCKTMRHVVLVGDHKQLGPQVRCPDVRKAGYGISCLARLALSYRPVMLVDQFRMHPQICSFPSRHTYAGRLRSKVTEKERDMTRNKFPWPKPGVPMYFTNVEGFEAVGPHGTSFQNLEEVDVVEETVRELRRHAPDSSIGVISFYEEQSERMRANMSHYKDIRVANIDAFQGRECDYIVISCVRSNGRGDVGFTGDPNRLNVAITRARFGLIVVGNARTLEYDAEWGALVKDMYTRGLIVDGYGPTNLRRTAFAPTAQQAIAAKAAAATAAASSASSAAAAAAGSAASSAAAAGAGAGTSSRAGAAHPTGANAPAAAISSGVLRVVPASASAAAAAAAGPSSEAERREAFQMLNAAASNAYDSNDYYAVLLQRLQAILAPRSF